MRRKKMRTGAAILALSAAVAIAGVEPVSVSAAPGTQTEAEELPEGMELAASNEYLEFYLDEDTADFAVRELASGKLWYSAPQKEGKTQATSYYQSLMKAQVTVQYYNESVQRSEMDSCNDSVEEEQFSIEYGENGVTITYLLGESSAMLLLPTAISEERMTAFLAEMDESAVKKITRNYTLLSLEDMDEEEKAENLELYPNLESYNIYELRSGVKDFLKEELAEYFEEAGYTMEDLELDQAELASTEEDESAWFQIPVMYELDGDCLVVTVDPMAITYNDENYYLTDVGVLPYFGAAGDDEEGYLFVPDGSGALIRLNNGKTSASSYDAMVYGQDLTMQVLAEKQSEIDDELSIKLPVYGIQTEEGAWMAVIEDGDAYANIAADISGKTTSYNHVYSHFSYLEHGGISLGDMVGSNSMQLYSSADFSGQYRLRLFFQGGEDADYSWMAGRYRQYLEDTGALTRLTEGESIPFYAEYLGALDKYESVLGIRYRAIKALTTYEQAEEITALLQEQGVEKPTIVYTGWNNGGLSNTAATKIAPLSQLNQGGVSLSEFQSDLQEMGLSVYMTVDYQNVYQDTLLDGYSQLSLAPRYFDYTTVQAMDANLVTKYLNGETSDLISPYFVEGIAQDSVGTLQKNGITGVNVGKLATTLYTDMLEERYTDAQAAMQANCAAIALLSEQMEQGTMANNANVYAFPYVSDLINTPLSSNHYYIVDEEIPFYQMVIHGYLQYAGDAMNLTDDYRTTFLKSLESGAGLYFQWIYADNSVVKDTDYTSLYSVNYETWLEQAAASYQELNEILGSLQTQLMVRHELLSTDFVRVTYEDGTQIYINYGEQEASADGVTVSAMDYAVSTDSSASKAASESTKDTGKEGENK